MEREGLKEPVALEPVALEPEPVEERSHYYATATYDPADDRIRLECVARLDADEYAEAKRCGFRWAPLQKVFYATWSPEAEDFAYRMAGDIDEEQTTREERAEERAERFERYSENRMKDAEQAREAVARIADGIPLGQPILAGHHSERHARRDAKRIENGMRRAVKAWETSKYWEERAAASLRHADRMERPDVRRRRIKKLEADRAREVRSYTPNRKAGAILQRPFLSEYRCAECGRMNEQHDETTGHEHVYMTEEQREAIPKVLHVWVGHSRGGHWVPAASIEARKARAQRWIEHIDLRLQYERAMLAAAGVPEKIEKPKRTLPPLLNYRAPGGHVVAHSLYRDNPQTLLQVETDSATFAAINKDYKGTRLVGKGAALHRVRTTCSRIPGNEERGLVAVFLTDSKEHAIPAQEPEASEVA